MDFFTHRSLRGFCEGFSKRVLSLFKNPFRKVGSFSVRLDPQRRWLKPLLLLVSAGQSAIWASQVSEKRALKTWLESHLPSDRVFRTAMEARGLRLLGGLQRVHKALRTLPLAVDDSGMVWMSSEPLWVAYFMASANGSSARIYCGQCQDLPKTWHALGVGWEGLETAQKAIEEKNSRMNGGVSKKSIQSYRDPRELIY